MDEMNKTAIYVLEFLNSRLGAEYVIEHGEITEVKSGNIEHVNQNN